VSFRRAKEDLAGRGSCTGLKAGDMDAVLVLLKGAITMRRYSLCLPRIGRNRGRAGRCPVRPAVETLEDRSLLSFFGTPIPFAVGPYPHAPLVADFTGDGKQDLAVVTSSPGGTVIVLLNNGMGGFAAPVSYSLPGASTLAVGDFNGDGRSDLAVAAGSGVDILLNHGDGTFAPAIVVNQPASSVVVGDFFGDGKQGLAVANNGTVSVLRNDGRANFTLASSYAVGSSSTALAVGDFNGDGKPDLVVSPGPSTGLAVLLNNGDGTFAAPLPVSIDSYTAVSSLEVADFNGDGKPDLLATEGVGGVAVLLGHGDGTFAPPDWVAGPCSTCWYGGGVSAAVGDFNGDGKPDIAFDTYSISPYSIHSSLEVALGNGDGTFQDPVQQSSDTVIYDLAVGDFNGDGRPDLAAVTDGPSVPIPFVSTDTVSMLLNTGGGPISGAYLGGFDPATATWYLRGSPGPGSPDVTAFHYGGAGWLPVVGDWDGNGTTTIGVVDPRSATWYLRNENNNSAIYPGVDVAPFPYGLPGWIPVVGDWNGTGHTGIGMFDPSTGTWYLRNEDSPGAPDAGVFQYGGAGWLPVVGDWTGSGRTTIGVVDPRTMTWYLRNSNSAGASDIAPFPYGGAGWKPVVGDWTSRGRTTIGAVDPSTQTWYLRSENSAGAPDVAAPFAFGLSGWAPLTGHFSGVVHTGIGMFDPATATWYLHNGVGAGAPDAGVFQYGAPGWIPVVGDWTGSGYTGIGVVDPATMTWYLRNEDSAGAPDAGVFQFGAPGWVPVVGHWAVPPGAHYYSPVNTGIGAFDPSTATWYLRNKVGPGAPDAGVKQFGAPGWIPVQDGWIGSSQSVPVVVDPGTMTWYLNISNPATQLQYGGVGWRPVMGDWNGDGGATVGVIDPNGVWYLSNYLGFVPPDIVPFPYGLGSWIPLVGHWWPVAGATGSARVADGRTLPPPLGRALTALSEAPAIPVTETAAMPASPPSPPPNVAEVPAPAGGGVIVAGMSAPSPRSVAVRQAWLAGQARAAVLDELFATGLE
jgi:hypothetical protein